MFSLTDISVSFRSGHILWVCLAAAVLIGATFVLYRRTNPPLPILIRLALGGLRLIAIVALIAALLEPVIGYQREFERTPRVTALLDYSASMDREEEGFTRLERMDSLLTGSTFRRFANMVDVETMYFGEKPGRLRSDIERGKTALGDALYEMEQRQIADPPDYILLMTDGNSNAGREPVDVLKNWRAPVVVVDMATDIGNFDIRLVDIDYNPVSFVGKPVTITTTLAWHNAVGRTARVEIRKGNRVLSSGNFPISEEGGYGRVELDYVPEEPGQQLLEISVLPLEGEESAANNARTISVKVLKSQLLVLLVSESPDYETGFLKRYLDGAERFDVDFIATGPKAGNFSGQFPQRQTELNRYDLVILDDPDPRKLSGQSDIIRSFVADKGGALWVFMGERFASRGPVPWLNALLPFSQSTTRRLIYMEHLAEPAESELFHPSVRLGDDRVSIRERWAGLPPFATLVACDSLDPAATILATAPGGGDRNWPVLGYKRIGPGKVFATASGPWWPIKFVALGMGDDPTVYDAFIEGTASWLTVSDDFDPVKIAPEKPVFTRGEAVSFSGRANDQGFRPIPGVMGTVTLQGTAGGERFEADIIETDTGLYRADFAQVPPGEYNWSAVMEKDGRVLKNENGSVQVESFSLEEFDQSGDPAGLQAVARMSRGSYHAYGDFDQAMASIDPAPVARIEKGELVIWGQYWMLLLFIGALALEWVFRKLNQLL